MNVEIAQKVVDETVGLNYVIYETEDSEKYTFAYYKHRDYDFDDQRGHLIGVGPVVFIKETKQYRLLGSGEMVLGDYFNHKQNFKEVKLSFDEIMAKIIRHKYVNEDDVFDLQRCWESEFGDSHLSLSYNKDFDFRNYLLISSSNPEFLKFLTNYFTKMSLTFELKNEEEILLSRNITVA